jgi:2-keto-3-deoxy-galactonokinase
VLFLGVDWGEAHHDLCLLNQDGQVLAARRIMDGLAGVGGAGGCNPPAILADVVARGPWC